MTSNYSVFKKPKVVEEVPFINLSENIKIVPEIEAQDKMFVGNKIINESIVFNNLDGTKSLNLMFREWVDSAGQVIEKSRINFIAADKFPDGCFFLQDPVAKKIKCYICEMKHRPGDKILDIAKQFYSGYVHCKTFFAAVGLDNEYEFEYQFFIVGYIKDYEVFDKQLVTPGVVRPAPGVRPIPPKMTPDLRAYQNFKLGKIYYAYTSDYQQKLTFPTEFIKLDFVNIDASTKTVNLSTAKNLSFT